MRGPAALAGFHRRNFGLDEAGRSADGDVTLTDGGYDVTLFRLRPELREPRMELGLHHIGIAVDDVDAVVARHGAHDPRGTVVAESGDLQHGQVRIYDPECNPVTLWRNNFSLGSASTRVPRIAHLALNALDTEAILDFYRNVFGFRELFGAHKESRKRPGYRNKHVGDGHSNVAIQAFYSGEEGHEARFGVAHFGFLSPIRRRWPSGFKPMAPRAAARCQCWRAGGAGDGAAPCLRCNTRRSDFPGRCGAAEP